jgi:hypothetical protein
MQFLSYEENREPIYEISDHGHAAVQLNYFAAVLHVFPPEHDPWPEKTDEQEQPGGNADVQKKLADKKHTTRGLKNITCMHWHKIFESHYLCVFVFTDGSRYRQNIQRTLTF